MTDKKAVAVYNGVEKILKTGDNLVEEGGDIANIDDAAFGAGWDGDLRGASKNSIYDTLNIPKSGGVSDDGDWFSYQLNHGTDEWETTYLTIDSRACLMIASTSGTYSGEAISEVLGTEDSDDFWMEWDDINEIEFEFMARFDYSVGAENQIIGIGSISSSVFRGGTIQGKGIAFRKASLGLYAETDDGTTSTSNLISGLNEDNWHAYKIWTDGATAKFYVDGALVDTITTNLPSGTNRVYFGMGQGTISDLYIAGIVCRIKFK